MKAFSTFLREENAQGSIEYFLMVGSVMVAAVMIFSSYFKMTERSRGALNESTFQVAVETCTYVGKALDQTWDFCDDIP